MQQSVRRKMNKVVKSWLEAIAVHHLTLPWSCQKLEQMNSFGCDSEKREKAVPGMVNDMYLSTCLLVKFHMFHCILPHEKLWCILKKKHPQYWEEYVEYPSFEPAKNPFIPQQPWDPSWRFTRLPTPSTKVEVSHQRGLHCSLPTIDIQII